MGQFFKSTQTVGDFDGTITGVFSLAYPNISEDLGVVADGICVKTTAPNAGFQWVEVWWRNPADASTILVGSSAAASMLALSASSFVVRLCPGIVPRLADKRFFDLVVVSSGVGAETIFAYVWGRNGISLGNGEVR